MGESYWPILYRLLLKVKRAEKHIHELNDAWAAFLEKNPYSVSFKDDPKTGERTYSLASVKTIPEELPLIVGDAIHNLRSALDHLAHHLVAVHTKTPGPFSGIDFPVGATPQKYKAKRSRIVKRIGRRAMYEIDRLEPYGTGRGNHLWMLHQLDITDKHKLILTVGSVNFVQSMPPSERAAIAKNFLGIWPTVPGARDVWINSPTVHFPLKVGDVLAVRPKSEVDEEMDFPFEIAFAQPETAKGKSVEETLGQMAHFIRQLFRRFGDEGLLE